VYVYSQVTERLPEYDAVEIKRIFNDASRRNTDSQNVLKRRKIIRFRYRVNAVEIAVQHILFIYRIYFILQK